MSKDAAKPAVQGEIPGSAPDLLSGRSALHWIRVTTALVIAGGAVILVLVPLGAIALSGSMRVFEIGLATLVAVGIWVAAGVAAIREGRVSLKELNAGYTTLYGMYFDHWQLDAKTGDVLRRPGERVANKRRSW